MSQDHCAKTGETMVVSADWRWWQRFWRTG
jgi:hypothetical protein